MPKASLLAAARMAGHRGADCRGCNTSIRNGLILTTFVTGAAAWTPDEGNTWFTLPGVSGYWAVAFASHKAGWLVGTDGRILKISF